MHIRRDRHDTASTAQLDFPIVNSFLQTIDPLVIQGQDREIWRRVSGQMHAGYEKEREVVINMQMTVSDTVAITKWQMQ